VSSLQAHSQQLNNLFPTIHTIKYTDRSKRSLKKWTPTTWCPRLAQKNSESILYGAISIHLYDVRSWDEFYARDIKIYDDIGDEGEIW
jgi:hypothetical protein